MILTVIIAASTAYFAFRDIGAAMHERKLVYNGIKVPATVKLIDNYERRDRVFTREEAHTLRISYTPPDGKLIKTDLVLPATSGSDRIMVGEILDLRIDPDDPESITLQTQPRSWIAALSVVILLGPLSLLLLIVTLMQRRRVLKIWQNGRAAEAVVVDWHRSGIAPRSKVVRFTLEGQDDRRVFTTLFPHDAGELEPGDVIYVVMPPAKPGSAIVAELYA